MLLDNDLMNWKLETPNGSKYFYASQEHLMKAVEDGGSEYGASFLRMASYAMNPKGEFIKSRTSTPDLMNMLIILGRDTVNQFFDQMDKIK